jgi:hypothetical protein
MTLVLNEIHGLGASRSPLMIAAADRRISNANGSYHSTRRKLFPLPRLSGAVSYFGVAAFPQRAGIRYLSEWLPDFIRRTPAKNLGEFALHLRAELGALVPPAVLRRRVSGFHICGFDENDRPDFWFLSNIVAMDGFAYTQIRDSYTDPASHFLGRDAAAFGWDPTTGRAQSGHVQIYRNGDFRVHAVASEMLDRMLDTLGQFADFSRPTNATEYGKYVKFKFEVIAYVYKTWARRPIIARPIDVIVLDGPRHRI